MSAKERLQILKKTDAIRIELEDKYKGILDDAIKIISTMQQDIPRLHCDGNPIGDRVGRVMVCACTGNCIPHNTAVNALMTSIHELEYPEKVTEQTE